MVISRSELEAAANSKEKEPSALLLRRFKETYTEVKVWVDSWLSWEVAEFPETAVSCLEWWWAGAKSGKVS